MAHRSPLGPSGTRPTVATFQVMDREHPTLIGAADVARLEGVLERLLGWVGMNYERAHLDPEPAPREAPIHVSLPGQTKPLWLNAKLDQIVGARVAVVARNTRISVVNGVVFLAAPTPRALIGRMRLVNGVIGVRPSAF